MRSTLLLSPLRRSWVARTTCMYYPNAMKPARAAQAGFDAIWLDAEHNANTWDGATGLMIPLVNTPADAHALARAVKFHPLSQCDLDGHFYLKGTA